MAQACISTYSRGRDQEYKGSMPAWAKSKTSSQNAQHKIGMMEWLK
jgi:hypothetical protein